MYGRRGGRQADSEGAARAGHSEEAGEGPSEAPAPGPRRGRGQPELQARLTAAPVFVHGSPATQHGPRHVQPLVGPGHSHGTGRGRGRRGPKEDDEAQDDHRAVGAGPRRASLAVGGSVLEAACSVCVEPVRYFAVGACNHRTVCHICALRLRALSENTVCVLCRSEQESVVFTRDMATPFQDMKLTGKPFDKRWGVYFESSELHSEVQKLFAHDCSVCGMDCKTLKGLKEHLKRVHELFVCDLCVAHLKVFLCEQRLYTRRDLARHRRHGDKDDTSHKGHPLCEFCQLHFYGNDELLEHLRDRHFRCHLCHRAGLANAYYGDYPELQRHFERDHILCPEQECMDKKYVVFASDLEYRAHIAEEHAKGLSRAQKKQALQIELGFQYDPPPDTDQASLGRGRGRGRGRREPSPARSPGGPSRSASSQALDTLAPDLSDMGAGPTPLWVPGRTAPGGSMADAQFPALASNGVAPSPVGGLVAKKKKQKQQPAAPQQQPPAGARPPPAGFGLSVSGARAPPAGFGTTPTMRPVEPPKPSPPPPAPAPAPAPQPAAAARVTAPAAFPPLSATAPRPAAAPVGRGAPAPAASRRPTREEMFPALAPVPQPARPLGRGAGPNAAMVAAAGPPPAASSSPRPLASDAFPALSAPPRPTPAAAPKATPAATTPPAATSAAHFPSLGSGGGGKKALQDSGWVKPANYEARSAALAQRIREALGSGEQFHEFKRLAGDYRSGALDAATYYGHYCRLLGTHAAGLFHEMVALLPDTERQRGLLGAHSDAKAVQEQQRDEEEVRRVLVIKTKAKSNWATSSSALPPRRTPHFLCPTCRQMVPHSDAQAHASTHKTAPAQQSAWL